VHLLNVDPGFDPHNVLTLKTHVYGARYQKPEVELQYYEQAFARLRATAGIESVAMTSLIPLTDFDRAGFIFAIAGRRTDR
jgi:putative ABC transport system permease protein